jgi:hypothetical protein
MALPIEMVQASKVLNEHNDCGVKAIAIACKRDYEIVHNTAQECGRRNRKGMSTSMISTTIRKLGFKINEIVSHDWCSTTYRFKRSTDVYGKTVMNLKLDALRQYIVLTSTHALAVVGGVVQDWTQNRRHQIHQIWEITQSVKVTQGEHYGSVVWFVSINGRRVSHQPSKEAATTFGEEWVRCE